MNYLKIGKADDLQSKKDRFLYRFLEVMPGFFTWLTFLSLIILSYLKPVIAAIFIIIFDIYWLLLVAYLGIYLIVAYKRLKLNLKIDWQKKCKAIKDWDKVYHLIILPTYNEGLEIVQQSIQGLVDNKYPLDKMIVVLAIEQRAGERARKIAKIIEEKFANKFYRFLITIHPENIQGELKGKGANQAWAARIAKKNIIDKERIDYDKILVTVFDIDTVAYPEYFYRLTYAFLTVKNPYQASYQPIPVYYNNLWQAPFFSRIIAMSNTFWQMMQQIRREKLATYSSHSMTWKTLVNIDFWSTNMVSEDSRIFWHCFCYYNGHYRVEPLHFPVSMDVCMGKTNWQTIKNLYKQQRRWGWGVENLPYMIFNFIKRWDKIDFKTKWSKIFVQFYGFHSWATNALIIAVIGWMPLLLGGDKFNSTILSSNLPYITRTLMTLAMIGLIISAIISTLLLPRKPKNYKNWEYFKMIIQWTILPITIIFFGSFPAIDAQTRLMIGKYLGFWVTPKVRKTHNNNT